MTDVATALREGLFASPVQPSQHPSRGAARHAAFVELKRQHATGCTNVVATEYGDHPDTAAARMAWCCTMVGAR